MSSIPIDLFQNGLPEVSRAIDFHQEDLSRPRARVFHLHVSPLASPDLRLVFAYDHPPQCLTSPHSPEKNVHEFENQHDMTYTTK